MNVALQREKSQLQTEIKIASAEKAELERQIQEEYVSSFIHRELEYRLFQEQQERKRGEEQLANFEMEISVLKRKLELVDRPVPFARFEGEQKQKIVDEYESKLRKEKKAFYRAIFITLALTMSIAVSGFLYWVELPFEVKESFLLDFFGIFLPEPLILPSPR